MDQHRADAERFMAAYARKPLNFPLDGVEAEGLLTKSALLPYRRAGAGIDICLMRPVGKKEELGASLYEICKGTRMWRLPDGTWMDLKKEPYPTEGTAEDLLMTALREAGEEMALPLDAVRQLRDAGVQPFTSASTGARKQMQLYLAEMREDVTVIAPDSESSGTESVEWFALGEAGEDVRIRPDHRIILQRLAAVL